MAEKKELLAWLACLYLPVSGASFYIAYYYRNGFLAKNWFPALALAWGIVCVIGTWDYAQALLSEKTRVSRRQIAKMKFIALPAALLAAAAAYFARADHMNSQFSGYGMGSPQAAAVVPYPGLSTTPSVSHAAPLPGLYSHAHQHSHSQAPQQWQVRQYGGGSRGDDSDDESDDSVLSTERHSRYHSHGGHSSSRAHHHSSRTGGFVSSHIRHIRRD